MEQKLGYVVLVHLELGLEKILQELQQELLVEEVLEELRHILQELEHRCLVGKLRLFQVLKFQLECRHKDELLSILIHLLELLCTIHTIQ